MEDGDDWGGEASKSAAPVATSAITTVSCSIVDKLKTFFHKDEFSFIVEQWNSLRAQVIEDLCAKFLFVEFERECRSKLLHEAKAHIFNDCAYKLGLILKQAPYGSDTVRPLLNTMDLSDVGLRVLAIAYGTSEDAGEAGSVSVASIVNGNGEIEEYIRLRHINLKLHRNKVGFKFFNLFLLIKST